MLAVVPVHALWIVVGLREPQIDNIAGLWVATRIRLARAGVGEAQRMRSPRAAYRVLSTR